MNARRDVVVRVRSIEEDMALAATARAAALAADADRAAATAAARAKEHPLRGHTGGLRPGELMTAAGVASALRESALSAERRAGLAAQSLDSARVEAMAASSRRRAAERLVERRVAAVRLEEARRDQRTLDESVDSPARRAMSVPAAVQEVMARIGALSSRPEPLQRLDDRFAAMAGRAIGSTTTATGNDQVIAGRASMARTASFGGSFVMGGATTTVSSDTGWVSRIPNESRQGVGAGHRGRCGTSRPGAGLLGCGVLDRVVVHPRRRVAHGCHRSGPADARDRRVAGCEPVGPDAEHRRVGHPVRPAA